MYRSAVGNSSREMASVFHQYGKTHRTAGDLKQAESYARDSMARFSKLLDERHPSTLRGEVLLAEIYLDAGDNSSCSTMSRDVMSKLDKLPAGGRLAKEQDC